MRVTASGPARREARSDVEQTLMAAIGCGELAPGVVFSTAALARRYRSPVATVRRALRSLAQDRLVEPIVGRGFRPAEPSVEELRELMELRRSIEVPAARQAAERGLSDADVDRLRALARTSVQTAQAGDVVGYIRADLAFHLFLVGLGGDTHKVEVVRLLRTRCRIDKLVYPMERFMLRNAQEHMTLVALCRVGDSIGAGDLLFGHITRPLADHRDVRTAHLDPAE